MYDNDKENLTLALQYSKSPIKIVLKYVMSFQLNFQNGGEGTFILKLGKRKSKALFPPRVISKKGGRKRTVEQNKKRMDYLLKLYPKFRKHI